MADRRSVNEPTASTHHMRTRARTRALTRLQATQGPWVGQAVDREALRAQKYCTQKCLRGLKRRTKLDLKCPNVERHRANNGRRSSSSSSSSSSTHHPTTAWGLTKIIQAALEQHPECAIPFEELGTAHGHGPETRSGSSGAPFKVVCPRFGYTVVGKGTVCWIWPRLEREADVYAQILPAAQGSAVPEFLGKIHLQQPYAVADFGRVRHMLLMGYGGEEIGRYWLDPAMRKYHRRRSVEEICALGVVHKDLASRNVLWSPELARALIIDFEACTLCMDRVLKRPKWVPQRLIEGSRVCLANMVTEYRGHCKVHRICCHYDPDEDCPNRKYGLP
ncbi:uncharacterized protein BO97DRAFT_239718 [Aspergillus homomorphus CBS 101889]|uniref:Protein kinase domain-containing protein n=1 Tax=Aspergillus homomorphus (strain CBS 101889) TaxID=1450537 RepID=A0A395IAE9_ASPHC|nr:hypothetical protein BO97DRAFT_239718 [Aspergillus homomorphus CBS 101889]RAL15124.1 hypothetical protein BO97DRAFT_239718 [Aspergillus homomorphus CBS 101889]